ncbi:MAG: arginase family protein [Gemmataceae bacterium]
MNTRIVVCPLGLFGSPGTQAGAELIADAINELLDDNGAETRPHRARAYRDRVDIHELAFDTPEAVADWRAAAAEVVDEVRRAGDFLIWIGGNHLSMLPVYEALADGETLVVQFDAHLDAYNLRDTKAELNHGNYLRYATKLPDIVNVGHRDLFLRPAQVKRYFRATHAAPSVACDPNGTIAALTESAAAATRLFVDIDCDVFDPAYFPAVTHPLPFGLSPAMVLRLVEAIWSKKVIGVGLSEFDPGRDVRDQSLSTLVWLVEYLLLRVYEK